MREVRIAEELLDRTLGTSDLLWRRRGQDVGRQQLSQAVSSLETRRTILIRARAHVRDLSDQIKRLMNDPEFPVAGQTLIVNFPGNPKAIEEVFPVLAPVLGHAAATLGSEGGSRASH